MISFRNVRKSFGEKKVLRDVSFDIKKGEVFYIVGASGVGKSVLIKHLIGLLRADSGEIWFDGQEVAQLGEQALFPIRKRCAMVFQHSTLFDSMNCVDNVALPLRKHRGLASEPAKQEALRRLAQVQMEHHSRTFPAALGDGMRKRVAIARALTLNPDCVLFDEPTTSLDPVSARRVDRLIRQLSDTLGVTCVVVSHDLTSIFGIADRISMLYQGHVKLLGTPQEFRDSPDEIVQQFINSRADGPMEL